jgi:hypothetical protein
MVGAGAMILGGVVAIFFGVAAEGKALEDVATPLSVIAKPAEAIFRTGAEEVDPTARPVGGAGTVPDQRSADHDDPARTRPEDGPPLL